MPLGRTYAVSLVGMNGFVVEVESDIGQTLPAFILLGLPDASLSEAKERIRAAARNAGLPLTRRKITVNLIPASLPKRGSSFDLAIVMSALAAAGDVRNCGRTVYLAELGLDGRLRPVRGVLPAVMAAVDAGFPEVVVAAENAAEAALVPNAVVRSFDSLAEVALAYGADPAAVELPSPEVGLPALPAGRRDMPLVRKDMSDVAGQSEARFAVEVAAAGAHHLMMMGPPGAGKTMLAERLPDILPDLTDDQAMEVTAIHSLGSAESCRELKRRPPFESPHHTASAASIIGGGSGIPRPGAASRAHRGVLFLDEARNRQAPHSLPPGGYPQEARRELVLSMRTGSVGTMRAIDLETRVITVVDQIRAGRKVEDDLIECKREWPHEDKARQLAGGLNRAAGEPVVYIIGIDERTGEVHDTTEVDVNDWWSQIESRFDQTPPELIRHINVRVDDGGGFVTALAIASDRAPYVVKTGRDNPNLEVPIREGTRTRTARRDELLRMLIPTVSVPQTVVLSVNLYSEFFPYRAPYQLPMGGYTEGIAESLRCSGLINLFVEHRGQELVTLPRHGMSGRVRIDDQVIQLAVRPIPYPSNHPPQSRSLTIQRQRDEVILTGPGAFPLELEVDGLDPTLLPLLERSDEINLEIEMMVLHAGRTMKINAVLRRTSPSNIGEPIRDEVFDDRKTAGTWEYQHSGSTFDE